SGLRPDISDKSKMPSACLSMYRLLLGKSITGMLLCSLMSRIMLAWFSEVIRLPPTKKKSTWWVSLSDSRFRQEASSRLSGSSRTAKCFLPDICFCEQRFLNGILFWNNNLSCLYYSYLFNRGCCNIVIFRDTIQMIAYLF